MNKCELLCMLLHTCSRQNSLTHVISLMCMITVQFALYVLANEVYQIQDIYNLHDNFKKADFNR